MQCPVSINYLRQYANSYISYTMVSVLVKLASCSWIRTLSNSRQHTLAVVLLHQLSSSALRKEVSGYKFCDFVVCRLICIPSLVCLFGSRICYFHLVLSYRVLHRVGCKSDVVVVISQCFKPWLRV